MPSYGPWIQGDDYSQTTLIATEQGQQGAAGSGTGFGPYGSRAALQAAVDAVIPSTIPVPSMTSGLFAPPHILNVAMDSDAFPATGYLASSTSYAHALTFTVGTGSGQDFGTWPDGAIDVEEHPDDSYELTGGHYDFRISDFSLDGSQRPTFQTAVGEFVATLTASGTTGTDDVRTYAGPQADGTTETGSIDIAPLVTELGELVQIVMTLAVPFADWVDIGNADPESVAYLVAYDEHALVADVHPPRYRFVFEGTSVTLAPVARLSGRGDGRGPLGGPRRLDTAPVASSTRSFRPGAPGSYT